MSHTEGPEWDARDQALLDALNGAGEAEDAASLAADEAALRALPLPMPPPSIRREVLRAIAPSPMRSRQVSLRALALAAGLAFACGIAVTAWLTRPAAPGAPASQGTASPAAPDDGRVPVRFVYLSEGTRTVQLVGDFDDWGRRELLLTPTGVAGVFEATVRLPPGKHEYMFVVDGDRWVPDPNARLSRSDGFGQTNSVIRVARRTL